MSNFRITSISAFIAIDPETGDEGMIGELVGATWIPFVMADAARLESLRPRAEAIANASGVVVKLIRFSVREDVSTILPVRGEG